MPWRRHIFKEELETELKTVKLCVSENAAGILIAFGSSGPILLKIKTKILFHMSLQSSKNAFYHGIITLPSLFHSIFVLGGGKVSCFTKPQVTIMHTRDFFSTSMWEKCVFCVLMNLGINKFLKIYFSWHPMIIFFLEERKV